MVADDDEEDLPVRAAAPEPPDEPGEGAIDVLEGGAELEALGPVRVGHLVRPEEVRPRERRKFPRVERPHVRVADVVERLAVEELPVPPRVRGGQREDVLHVDRGAACDRAGHGHRIGREPLVERAGVGREEVRGGEDAEDVRVRLREAEAAVQPDVRRDAVVTRIETRQEGAEVRVGLARDRGDGRLEDEAPLDDLLPEVRNGTGGEEVSEGLGGEAVEEEDADGPVVRRRQGARRAPHPLVDRAGGERHGRHEGGGERKEAARRHRLVGLSRGREDVPASGRPRRSGERSGRRPRRSRPYGPRRHPTGRREGRRGRERRG